MAERKPTITPDHEQLNFLLSQYKTKSPDEQEILTKNAVNLFLAGDLKTNKINFYQSGEKLLEICPIEDQEKIIQKMTDRYFYALDQNQHQGDFEIKARGIILESILVPYSDKKANALFTKINEIYNKETPKNPNSREAIQYFHLKIGDFRDWQNQ